MSADQTTIIDEITTIGDKLGDAIEQTSELAKELLSLYNENLPLEFESRVAIQRLMEATGAEINPNTAGPNGEEAVVFDAQSAQLVKLKESLMWAEHSIKTNN